MIAWNSELLHPPWGMAKPGVSSPSSWIPAIWNSGSQRQAPVPPSYPRRFLANPEDIVRASRHGGRSISRADAEGVFLAKQHGFVLVTGDNRQAEIAARKGVTGRPQRNYARIPCYHQIIAHNDFVLRVMPADLTKSPRLSVRFARFIPSPARGNPPAAMLVGCRTIRLSLPPHQNPGGDHYVRCRRWPDFCPGK